MLRFRPMPILTIASIVSFVILLQLGAWQWQRYEQKRASAVTPPPIEVVSVVEAPRGPVQLVYGLRDGQAGWRVLTPLPQGDAVLFVDAAFVPGVAPPDPATLPRFAVTPGATLDGVRIEPHPSPFAGKPDPARGVWYQLDLAGMARAAGYARSASYALAVPYVGPDGRSIPNPFAHARDPLPPERHLGYAATWWGLAIGLLVIYALMHVRQGRLRWERR